MPRDRDSSATDQALRPAVFFDRDGVLNVDTDYLFEIDKFVWIDGAIEAVKAANEAGYFAFVITNQSGVARGFYEETDVRRLHDWMARELEARGARIDAFEYCPFHPHGCIERYRRISERRKPQPGMIIDLLNKFPVDASRSFVVGDRPSDIEAAHAAGLAGHAFPGGNLRDFVLPLLGNG
jgi:D-glycero-D-manno-heptose 1,7-bisphosphate phosphatase